MTLIEDLSKGAKEWKTISPNAVGANYPDISTAPGKTCDARRPDPAKAKAWLAANPGHHLIDCLSYAKRVVEWAYRRNGDAATADSLPNGLKILEFLVREKGWKGIFWSTDVVRPRKEYKRDPATGAVVEKWENYTDYVDSYIKATQGHYSPAGKYKIDVPVVACVVQFNPTPRASQSKQYPSRLSAAGLSVPAPNPALLQKLKRVRFGVVAGKGGDHNALLLSGLIYEVNYCVGPNSSALYHHGSFDDWAEQWGPGLVVAPASEWS